MKSIKVLSAALLALIITSSFLLLQNDPLQVSINRGEKLYKSNCMSCHMADGKGLQGVFPPLAESDYMLADPNRAIQEIKFGVKGKIMVNGKEYNGDMPGFQYLSDEQLADLTNYIFNSWGNKGKMITPQQVKEALK